MSQYRVGTIVRIVRPVYQLPNSFLLSFSEASLRTGLCGNTGIVLKPGPTTGELLVGIYMDGLFVQIWIRFDRLQIVEVCRLAFNKLVTLGFFKGPSPQPQLDLCILGWQQPSDLRRIQVSHPGRPR